MRKAAKYVDVGNAERHAKDQIEMVETSKAGERRAYVTTQTSLDRCRARGVVDDRQWQTGNMLRALFFDAGLEPRLIAKYEQTVPGNGGVSNKQAHAWSKYKEALRCLTERESSLVRAVSIWDVSLRDWAHGKMAHTKAPALLRGALDKMAHHLGI